MIRIIALVLSLTLESIQGFGVTSVDDTTTTTTTANIADGSTAGVGECFIASGDCASCCGACDKTTEEDNQAKDSCVCYEASTAPTSWFKATKYNDCVFIKADGVDGINVRNQCLEGARRQCSSRRRAADSARRGS